MPAWPCLVVLARKRADLDRQRHAAVCPLARALPCKGRDGVMSVACAAPKLSGAVRRPLERFRRRPRARGSVQRLERAQGPAFALDASSHAPP